MNKPKILLLDVETSPNLGYTWAIYEQNVIHVVKEWQILSFAAKWLGTSKVIGESQYTAVSEGLLLVQLWDLLNEADVVIAHNGDNFDVRKINARFLKVGLGPPKPYKTIDTKKVAKRYFALNSNKLDDIGKYLNLGQKMHHEGFGLWLGCMANNPKSWKTMLEYNKQDIVLLEKIYLKLRPWIKNHPNWNDYSDSSHTACPKCGSFQVESRGTRTTGTRTCRRFRCNYCGGWHTVALKKERPVYNI